MDSWGENLHYTKDEKGVYKCPACGEEAYYDSDYGQQLFVFCPWCGHDTRTEVKSRKYKAESEEQMIELVIKIPEEVYEMVMNTGTFGIHRFNTSKAIRNGTPLPQGHGRIGDIDRLQEVFRRNVAGADAYSDLFYNAPTIIEADRAESEG